MPLTPTSRAYQIWRVVGILMILGAATPLAGALFGDESGGMSKASLAVALVLGLIGVGGGVAILVAIKSVASVQRKAMFKSLARRWKLKHEENRGLHRDAGDLVFHGESGMRHFDVGHLLSGKLNGVKFHALDMRWGGYLMDRELITMDFRRLLEAVFEDHLLLGACSAVAAYPLSRKARLKCVERLGKIDGATIALPGAGIVMVAKRRMIDEKEFNEAIDALIEAAESEGPPPELMPTPGEFPGNY